MRTQTMEATVHQDRETAPLTVAGAAENRIRWASCSLAGPREENEDACTVATIDSPDSAFSVIAIVTDGMGGYAGGRWAARRGKRAIVGYLLSAVQQSTAESLSGNMVEYIYKSFRWANAKILSAAALDSARKDMGTTASCCVIRNNRLYVASVGDSRCYLLRDGEVIQLSHDNSVVQSLVDQGLLTPEEAEAHPRANELTRCLGSVDGLEELMVTECSLRPGDLILLCSDGLWKGGKEDIAGIPSSLECTFRSHDGLRQLAEDLALKAIDRGANDNVTLVLLQVCPEGPGESGGKSNGKPQPITEEK